MIDLQNINRNQLKLFAVVGGIILVVGVIFLVTANKALNTGPTRPNIKLTMWGTNEKSGDLEESIKSFKNLYESVYQSRIDVEYKSWPPETYEETLVDKIAVGQGPDIALIKGTWMLKHYPKLQPFPENFGGGYLTRSTTADIGVWTPDAFAQTYVRAAGDFVLQKRIYGVPLWADTLGLYYNEDLFRQAGIAPSRPAATWQELDAQIPSLRVTGYDTAGGIQRAAIALGAVSNIRVHAQRADQSLPTVIDDGTDLLSLFVLQSGGVYCRGFCESSSFGPETEDGFIRFLNYSTPSSPVYTWAPAFPRSLAKEYEDDSIDAFIAGDVAMVFGYSDIATEIQNRQAANSFKWYISPLPQIPDKDGKVERRALASVWGLSVTAGSKQKQAALEFVSFMGRTAPQLQHFKASKRPPARQDLLNKASELEPTLKPIIQQALIAESLQLYDERVVKAAIAKAIQARLEDPSGRVEVLRKISEALDAVTTSPARTPPPPAPSSPPGVRR